MPIAVTPAAEALMRRMVRFNSGAAHAGVRLTVTPGGCAGFATRFSIEALAQPGDSTLDVNGLAVFLPADTGALLAGATLDCRDGALAILNPHVSDCGCGSASTGRGGKHATVSVSAIRRKT